MLLSNNLFNLIAQSNKLHKAAIAKQKSALEKNSLSALDWVILRSLYYGQPRSQAEVARSIGKAPSNVRTPIEILEKKGLIQRETDVVDRRVNNTILSFKGSELVERLLPTIEASESALLEGLSAAEQKELERLLKAIVHKHEPPK